MATLQKIRTKAGLLVAIVIGISLAAFILGDMLQSGSSILQRNQMEVGEVNGEEIQYPEFQMQVEELAQIYRQNVNVNQLDDEMWTQVREQAWQNAVREIVMKDVYEDLGIEVSSDELFDMLQGTNLHPIIQQIFADQTTGQVNRSAVVNYLKNLETGLIAQEERDYWLYIENQIVNDRAQTKYANMVGKGLYVTNVEAESSLSANNKVVSFDYIALPVSEVLDSEVQVSESELKDYYNAHKNDYEQEKTRKIEYIEFPVTPSASDFTDAENWINDIKPEFESTTENIQFVNSNSDVSFDDTWYKETELPINISTWIFQEGAEVNDVFGPYFENDQYILAKLHALEMMPDSVEARHILLQPTANTQAEYDRISSLADSLKTAIENGSDFAALAQEFSVDQGSAILGGDLGWFGRGQMVLPFEEAAFNNAKNEVALAESQFGIHVIQTTNVGKLTKQAKVAYMVRTVQPSTKTYQDVYAQASKFASENTTGDDFETAVVEQKLNKKVATVGENDQMITGIENARTLIRAAYETKEGDIIMSLQGSPVFELGDNFLIGVVTNVTEEGIAPFEDVSARVELSVLKEKKIQYLIEKATNAATGKTELQSIAQELNKEVESATNINFNSFSVPAIGLEPAVIGYVTSLETNQISEPIAGNNGVYIVSVTSVNEQGNQDLAAEKLRLVQNYTMRALSESYNAHQEAAEITDKRSKFY
ncbi:MAG: SurA N-terminal domain-containing protein [Prolixibacteraceae bacterium]|nr:SurA N-terminal domain-containing protein [Prolixibacteraceae bacterium]